MTPGPCCATCRWWRRLHPDAETGLCRSATDNDYAGASLDRADDAGAELVTHESHACADHQDADDADPA